MRPALKALLASALAALAAACAAEAPQSAAPDASGPPPEPPAPRYIEAGLPDLLSDWGQLAAGGGSLVLGEDVTPYDLNTALFSDYALKLRTVWTPEGAGPAAYDPREAFEFPVGTVITKTFYYPRAGGGFERVSRDGVSMAHFDGRALDMDEVRLIETRVLVRREAGWEALPYVWDEDQSEARLSRPGAFVDLVLVGEAGAQRLDYMVPNVNQCANCHVTDTTDGRGVRPIGPKARHLNGDFAYADGVENQLDRWTAAGLLSGAPEPGSAPASAAWASGVPISDLELEAAARSYIDINCAHCHSRTGQADTSGLYLEPWEPAGPNFGLCKPPIAAGRGTGNRLYGIVPGDADASIFAHRMASDRADIMMPELGRAVAHEEGVALVAAWIDQMSGGCG
ncbi:MAG: SO2930 family diheme c-type cytochrome [Oceanicaulis sp.]